MGVGWGLVGGWKIGLGLGAGGGGGHGSGGLEGLTFGDHHEPQFVVLTHLTMARLKCGE